LKKLILILLLPTFLLSQESEKERLLQTIKSSKNIDDKVQAYADLAWEYILEGNDSALIYAEQAEMFSSENNYPLGQAIALETKGLFYELGTGDYDKASKHYFDGIKVCEENKLDYATSIYNSLGVMFHTSDNYEKAKVYYNIAYTRAVQEGKFQIQKKCLINLGGLYSSLKEYDKSEELLLKSLKINERQELDYDTYANLGNLYSRQEKYEEAISFLLLATKQNEENYNSEANLYFLINTKTLANDTNGMQPVLQRANTFVKEATSPRDKSLTLMFLSNYYRMIGEYQKALELRDEYLTLYEEIKEKQRDETVYELEGQFQNEKKEREIAEQKLEIKEKNQWLFGLALIGLALITGFVLLRKRMKYQKIITEQKNEISNKKIEELNHRNKVTALSSMVEGQEKERLRIAKDLHDSLGGLLSSVKTHFSSMTNQCDDIKELELTKKTTDLIDEACIEVRRISHNMMPHSLSISGLVGAVEDLGEQLTTEGYQMTLEISNVPENIEDTKKIVVFRLLQELISNCKKHANAKSILVQMLSREQQLIILVEDDGVGFNYEEAIKKEGIGLESINSRVEFLNGTIHWDAQEGTGSSVTINIPL